MNQELTPTEQKKVEQAANDKYPVGFPFSDFFEARGFRAGASYYVKEVMPGELAKAMEWISLKGLYQEIDGRWYDKFGGKVRKVAETTKDLLVLFENYRQKDNVQPT